MADSLARLMRLLDQMGEDEAAPEPRRNRNNRNRAPRNNSAPPSHNSSSPPKFNNSGTQNMTGLINNAGYVEGNGNGSIISGGFDSSTKNYY
ncbi:hypothetical protein LR48_Vigan09g167900 [Vigna angularis]|uniref:Uncharacterized protein n=2 Tax=Phaseolus angularis TaxID=3914 RepID=A0A0L9VD92_PHAAN|nr:hypothetical protein LR48_Vigan09g167900 [Vigna angularis]BAT87799.1 hypothetical protein VIGAN_05120700 [Vigna angularis var. angularis]